MLRFGYIGIISSYIDNIVNYLVCTTYEQRFEGLGHFGVAYTSTWKK